METNENENTTVQNLWDAANVVLRKKYIAIQAFLKKRVRSQIHKLTLYLKEMEKEQRIELKPSKRRELIKIRAEINEIEPERIVEEINDVGVGSLKELIRSINPWPGLSRRKEKEPK